MKPNLVVLTGALLLTLCGCGYSGKQSAAAAIYKGVYSFGPEVKSFKDCETSSEFWVGGDCTALEAEYDKLNFEKPYEPVYIEVEANKVKATKADALDAQYDSIMVVKKLVKITKVIPQDMCN